MRVVILEGFPFKIKPCSTSLQIVILVLEHIESESIVILKELLAGMMNSLSTLPQYFTKAMLIGLIAEIVNF